eukprot:12419119-Prorocentrum_lima.AAC.1
MLGQPGGKAACQWIKGRESPHQDFAEGPFGVHQKQASVDLHAASWKQLWQQGLGLPPEMKQTF